MIKTMAVKPKQLIATLAITAVVGAGSWYGYLMMNQPAIKSSVAAVNQPAVNGAKFLSGWQFNGALEETNTAAASANPYWWLSSGGRFSVQNGLGYTLQGDLPPSDRWYQRYGSANSLDTDKGAHPQNIFRLVTRQTWLNYDQQVYFKINKNNLSASPNRNASNGLFFFNRYQDENNLYYLGWRVDGYAVIKKKINGVYYTLAAQRIFDGADYNRDTNPNLLPIDAWLGLKAEVVNQPNQSVSLKLFIDKNHTNHWQLAVQAIDTGRGISGAVFSQAGHTGLRADFMDITFDGYQISSL
jgi:hypothetical protein